MDVSTINQDTFDLSAKNPHAPEEAPPKTPEAIIEEIAALDANSAELLKAIRALLRI